MLDALAEAARADGTRVLRAGGVEFEANCSYSGLNQILFPFQDALGELQAPFRDALRVALGFESGSPPERLMVSNAVLLLLSTVAAGDPFCSSSTTCPGSTGRARPYWVSSHAGQPASA